MRRTWVTGAGILLLAGSATADDGVDYSQAFLWQSSVPRDAAPRAVIPMGDHVIVIGFDADDGAELAAIDLSEADAPVERGAVSVDGVPGQAIAVGDVVLVAAGAAGIVAVDVSDLDAPVVAHTLSLPGAARFIAPGPDDVVLVGLGSMWGRIDVTDPRQPQLAATVAANDWAGGVAMAGDRALGAAGRDGIVEFDLSGNDIAIVERTPTDGYAFDIAATSDVVAVADGERGLLVIEPGVGSLAKVAQLPVAELAHAVRRVDDQTIAVGDLTQGWWLVDVSTPVDPRVRRRLLSLREGGDVAAVGDRLLVGDGVAGLTVYAHWQADPVAPLGAFDPGEVRDVAVGADDVYVAALTDGMVVLDRETLEPELTLTLDIDVRGVAALDDRLVAWSGASLAVLETGGRPAPTVTGRLDFGQEVRGVAVTPTHAYVAASWDSLHVVRLDGDAPLRVSALSSGGLMADAEVVGDRLFTLDRHFGFSTFDLTDPDHPELIRRESLSRRCEAMDVEGRMVALYYRNVVGWPVGGLLVARLDEDYALTETANLPLPGAPLDVTLDGDLAYVADAWTGVEVVDLTAPHAPELRGAILAGGQAWAAKVADERVLVASGAAGFEAFPVARSPSTPIDETGPDVVSPLDLRVGAARPNPSAGWVRVPLALPDGAVARAVVIDIAGREVRRLSLTSNEVLWDGRDGGGRPVSPGRYFVRVEVGTSAITRSVTIVE